MKNKKVLSTSLALLTSALVVPSQLLSTVTLASQDDQVVSDVQTNYVCSLDGSERSNDFNANWRFTMGDPAASQPGYDDSKWEIVSLPHDYSITQEYDPSNEAESAYLPGGTAWYRKTFSLDESVKGKRVTIDFDGVYMNATVYINGHKLGDHPYGYSPFSFDLTDYLNFDGENFIAVRVNHQLPSSRWYSGSGIYRDVKLTITDAVAVDRYGSYVTAPKLEEQKDGAVETVIENTLINKTDESQTVSLRQSIVDHETGETAASQTFDGVVLEPGTTTVTHTVSVDTPELWSTSDANLYDVVTEVISGSDVLDTYETLFGYRWFNFDANNGFSLNGESMKLNGVCMHHDQGSLGSVSVRRAVERQMEILKEMGVNAIRTSHNPQSALFMELAAENGILVVEEFFDGWATAKNGNTQDYSNYFNTLIGENELIHSDADETWAKYDMQEVLYRDRSNPSVIMWSLGNEIDAGDSSKFPEYCDNLIEWTKELDSRPVTLGDNKMLGNDQDWARSIRQKIADAGGIIGSNYGLANNLQSQYRNTYPDWKYYGSENVSSVNSRGIYDRIANSSDVNNDK